MMRTFGTFSTCTLAIACALVACDQPSTAKPDTAPVASAAPVASVAVAPVADLASGSSGAHPAPAAAGGDAAAASPVSVQAAAPSAKPSAAGSASGKTAASPAPSASGVALPLAPASTRVVGKNFALDVASPGCRVDADCTVTLRLAPQGEYHVNKEYPYKFVAQAAPTHTFLGKDDPNTFSKAAGDYREEGEKASTLTVRFRAKSPGEAKIVGTYKMSVCSAENCQIETPRVELAVTVK